MPEGEGVSWIATALHATAWPGAEDNVHLLVASLAANVAASVRCCVQTVDLQDHGAFASMRMHSGVWAFISQHRVLSVVGFVWFDMCCGVWHCGSMSAQYPFFSVVMLAQP